MSRMIPTLSIVDVTTGYRHKNKIYPVAKHLNASLYAGELTCLLGANGSGKSTLLRTMTSFLDPLYGEVRLLDKSLTRYTRDELSRLVGVVLTDKVETSDLRVYDLVAMGRMPYTGFWGRLSDHDHTLVEEAIEQVGISHLKNRLLHSLSDGELQKALIAKTLAQETPFIFLDEPSAFLDYPSKVELFLLLRRLAIEEQKTIFLSTHDLDLVLQMADRLWLLQENGELSTGIPEDLVAQGFLYHYLSHPNMCFDAARVAYHVKMPLNNGPKIQISGNEGLSKTLLQRALERKGFACGSNQDVAYQILVQDETPIYTLRCEATTLLQTNCINDLLQEI